MHKSSQNIISVFQNKVSLWGLILITFLACEKPDKRYLLPPKPGDSIEVRQLDLGENYENQIYVNLLDQNIIKSTVKYDSWDLAFECGGNGTRVFMNGGKGVLIGSIGREKEPGKFLQSVNLSQVKWRWDEASGGDSIVLNRWLDQFNHSYDSVYIIDRGIESEPGKRYYQFKLNFGLFGFDDYFINVADLQGKNLFIAVIHKDPSKNLVFMDFGKPALLNFEPYQQDWHICFMRYRYVYHEFNPPLLYTVTGININPKTVCVAIDSTLRFENINLNAVKNLKYSNRRDAIGFEWKVYDFAQGRYITRKHVTYIIKTEGVNAVYYKLRFTDFYNNKGLKGSPKYEISRIK